MLRFDEDDRLAYIRYKGNLHLFSMKRWVWILDYNKWNMAWIKASTQHAIPIDLEDAKDRYGIMVLDTDTIDLFFKKARHRIIHIDDMKKFFKNKISKTNCYWDIENLLPRIYIDFDKKRLDACYSFDDSPFWELYAPEGWQARFFSFSTKYPEDLLPLDQKYWCINGANHIYLMNTDCNDEDES
ncbi:hypothetical protein [Bartonella sp. HY761]|uniref:hypothetical protein n=1 Tax=Bartonella sp. HY761 TaxID=2979330 RepID=UPI0022021D6D|nr:hypothetical protein [Bartonella sp. HY761]UXN05883.1 hypothetical protein N6A79_11380 [Bartonella sp. HY761]